MARVIIFGLRDSASLAHFYLRHDSEHEVVAFCVTSEFMPADPTFEGLPVVAFEDVQNHYSAQNHHFFAPMSGRDMNRRRATVYRQIKANGYELISYVSSRATVFEGTPIGDNCFILEDNTRTFFPTHRVKQSPVGCKTCGSPIPRPDPLVSLLDPYYHSQEILCQEKVSQAPNLSRVQIFR